jgi:DNA repair protein RadD
MLEQLRRMSRAELLSFLGQNEALLIADLMEEAGSPGQLTIDELAVCVESMYAFGLLQEERIRYSLFCSIAEEELGSLSLRYLGRKYDKPKDNALALTSVRWVAGSEFVEEVAGICKIGREYLPQAPIDDPFFETVFPDRELPGLFPYQRGLRNAIVASLEAGKKRFLIQMPTGAGKTRTVMEALVEYCQTKGEFAKGRSILWLAHSEELCEQALETFSRVWRAKGDADIGVIRNWGSRSATADLVGWCVIFSTLQKAYAMFKRTRLSFERIADMIAIAIVDEAHKSTARTYRELLEGITTRGSILIGTTATPGRGAYSPEENKDLADFFDRNLLSADLGAAPIESLRSQGVLASINRTVIETGIEVILTDGEMKKAESETDLPGIVLERLAANKERNRLIFGAIVESVQKKLPCLVFSCSNMHSRVLSTALKVKGIKCERIESGTQRTIRRKIVDDFRKGEIDVLLNYGILTTGFDAPVLRTVIITRPTNSIVLYSQMIGRGLRGPKMGGGSAVNLIDIHDNFKKFGGVEEVFKFFDGYWK